MIVVLLALAGVVACMGLALAGALRGAKEPSNYAFLAGMMLLALESLFTGMSFYTPDPEQIMHWQNLRLYCTGFSTGAWLLFSLTYARGNYREFLAKWWPLLAPMVLLPLVVILAFWESLVLCRREALPPHDWFLPLTWPGLVLHIVFLLAAILILMHLERTLRTSVGTMRWRIKFMILGLLLLFAVRIYTASQNLLFSKINLSLQKVDLIALLLVCGLISLSFWRSGYAKIDLYPSPSLLQSSVAVLFAGLYLLLVGALARLISLLGGDAAFGFKVFFILLSLIVLGGLLFSERVRQYLRLFVNRHFQRPDYDYRSVWTTFSVRTSFIMESPALCQTVVKWISETLNVLSVTIWLVDHVQPRLSLAASTAVTRKDAQTFLPLEGEAAQLVAELQRLAAPVDLDTSAEKWLQALKNSTTSVFSHGGNRVCVPIIGRGELVGILTIGDRVNGLPFTLEDFDLLKCIGDQVASQLVNIQLSQKLFQVKELEAFQTMAAFFVHDLKNVGSTLSLMLQNLGVHFDNPEFRKDALRSLGRSVSHLNELISRLSLLRQRLEISRVAADFNAVISAALENLPQPPGIKLHQNLQPLPKILFDPVQVQKVITNLLLNAVEAVGAQGEVRIETGQRQGWACFSIADNGAGMTPEFLATSLFRPFQTTKKQGLGIGMFQSKMIVDAHRGKMEVESQPGKGTTFRVLLPLQPELEKL